MKSHVDVAAYIHHATANSGKTNQQIAEETGFTQGNFVSMLRHGRSQLPLTRVHALAKSMGTDPAILFEGCLAAYHPDLHRVFKMLAPSMLISRGELAVVRALRHAVRAGAFAK